MGNKLTRRTAVVELADGRILEARIINPDSLRYEDTALRQGWPGVHIEDGVTRVDGTTKRATFEAYAALKRTGQYGGSWEAFEATDCVDVSIEEEQVDPTRPAPGSDSSQSSPGSDDAPSQSSETQTTNF